MVVVEPGLPDRESLFMETVASEDLLQASWQPGIAHVVILIGLLCRNFCRN